MRRKENEEAADSCEGSAGARYRDILRTAPLGGKEDFSAQAEALWQQLPLCVHSGERGGANWGPYCPLLYGVTVARP